LTDYPVLFALVWYTAEELKQKERDLRQAEKRANNLTADLSVEKQRFQRLLTSGGSSLEDVLSPKGAGKAARRSASMLMDGSMVLGSNPDSPSEILLALSSNPKSTLM
jgi:hypothetical protein